MADVVSAQVRIVCGCEVTFDVSLDEYADFAECPECGDVCWVDVEAREHWTTDPCERPDEDMIAVGTVIKEAP